MTQSPPYQPLTAPTYPATLDEQLRALETDEWGLRFAESRRRLASVDPYRPLYHFSSPENYMNDPNGLCQWDGRYHMFYQFKPSGVDRVHWGHTVSDDLIQWRDMPPALYPDVERDCFSGQTLVEPDRVIAIYHGTQSGNAIATASDPLLMNWQKHPNNPVIPGTNQGGGPGGYRVFDPCIWKEDDGYYSLSGTYKGGDRGRDGVGVDHIFRSKDLAEWEYLGPMLEDAFFAEPGEDGAVPNFWPIGNDRHMLLLFSHKRAGRYYIGKYDRDDTPLHARNPRAHELRPLGRRQSTRAVCDHRRLGPIPGHLQPPRRQGVARHRRDDDAAPPLLAGLRKTRSRWRRWPRSNRCGSITARSSRWIFPPTARLFWTASAERRSRSGPLSSRERRGRSVCTCYAPRTARSGRAFRCTLWTTADSTPARSRSTCRSRRSGATYGRGRPRSGR